MHLPGMRHAASSHDTTVELPVTVPHLVLRIDETGTVTATLDGQQVPPPEQVEAWRRGTFATLVDHVTNDRALPVRVTVHESDGTTFTDLLPPVTRHTPPPAETAEEPSVKRRRRARELIEVDGGAGFVPGEDVAVALIITHTDATPAGRVRALIETASIREVTGSEVVLLGRVSGTVTVKELT